MPILRVLLDPCRLASDPEAPIAGGGSQQTFCGNSRHHSCYMKADWCQLGIRHIGRTIQVGDSNARIAKRYDEDTSTDSIAQKSAVVNRKREAARIPGGAKAPIPPRVTALLNRKHRFAGVLGANSQGVIRKDVLKRNIAHFWDNVKCFRTLNFDLSVCLM